MLTSQRGTFFSAIEKSVSIPIEFVFKSNEHFFSIEVPQLLQKMVPNEI